MSRRHVTKGSDGWKNKKEGAERASSVHRTQAEAEKAAKQALQKEGGGEVVIHRPKGQIRDSDTVDPGNDPTPPRDKRH